MASSSGATALASLSSAMRRLLRPTVEDETCILGQCEARLGCVAEDRNGARLSAETRRYPMHGTRATKEDEGARVLGKFTNRFAAAVEHSSDPFIACF